MFSRNINRPNPHINVENSKLVLSVTDEPASHCWLSKTTLNLYFSNTSSTNENNFKVYEAWKPQNISQAFFFLLFFVFTLENVCHLFQEIVLCFWTVMVFRGRKWATLNVNAYTKCFWAHTLTKVAFFFFFFTHTDVSPDNTQTSIYIFFLVYIYTYIYTFTHRWKKKLPLFGLQGSVMKSSSHFKGLLVSFLKKYSRKIRN